MSPSGKEVSGLESFKNIFTVTKYFCSVSLRGTVIIIANHGDRIDIPAGAVLENKIVSGNLRILDH